MLAEPGTRARLAELGVEPMGGSPADFTSFIRSETAKWREITAAAGIIVE
jgi:tripartite-type tricarboxylate transporter receptor subunit TctC